jgi:antitoxin component YwqK of YwqJK toxin-antitoxin module
MKLSPALIASSVVAVLLGVAGLVWTSDSEPDKIDHALQQRFVDIKGKVIQTQALDDNLYQIQVFYPNDQSKFTDAFVARINDNDFLEIMGTISFYSPKQQLAYQCQDAAEVDTTCTYFDEKGKKTRLSTFKQGIKQGLEITYLADGSVKTETQFVNNLKSGPSRLYGANDEMIEENYLNGVLHGKSFKRLKGIVFNETLFNQGKMVYSAMYSNKQQLLFIQYFNQGENNKRIFFYPDGQKMVEEINPADPNLPEDSKRAYQLRKWYPNGQLAAEVIADGSDKPRTEQYWDKHGKTVPQMPSADNFIEPSDDSTSAASTETKSKA